jgi:hypothetical protein
MTTYRQTYCDICGEAIAEPCVDKVELVGGVRSFNGSLKKVVEIYFTDICPECRKWLLSEMKRVQRRLDKKIKYNKAAK